VQTIKFYENATTNLFPTSKISGLVDIVSRAYDRTDMGPLGSNNGVYSIGWEVFADDGSTSVQGPYFPFTFDTKPSDSYIKNVYFQGSNTSTYYYIVTNQISHDSFWDTRWVDPGHYVVAVYCCDTRDNWDTTTVWVEVAEQDVTPPEQPTLLSATGSRDNRLTVTWQANEDPELKGYRLYHSYDGINWSCNYDEEDLSDTTTQLVADPFQNNQDIYFKLTAVDSAAVPNESGGSDIYGARLTDIKPKALLVDGFDRTSDSWTQPSHPFALSHARALDALGMAFDCCANEVVIDGSILLSDYDAIVWILGDEGPEDSTFTPVEQSLVTAYLESGGNLLVSGSEVAYDLVEFGSPADTNFFHQVLKADFAANDAGVNAVEGIGGTIFEDLSFSFDDGTHGIYEENSPDALVARENSMVNAMYSGTSYGAALQYQGPIGLGIQESHLVYMGFPFETIYPESTRIEVIGRVMEFFTLTTPVEPGTTEDISMPGEFALHQNYPNPFNPATSISFTLPNDPHRTTLKIYNVKGQQVRTLVDAPLEQGFHTVIWDGRDVHGRPVSSGVYLYTLRIGPFVNTRKMVLLK